MKYKALVSFTGAFSMHKNEIKELPNKKITEQLVKIGYILPLQEIVKGKVVSKNKKGGKK